jgi:hypothetical protein
VDNEKDNCTYDFGNGFVLANLIDGLGPKAATRGVEDTDDFCEGNPPEQISQMFFSTKIPILQT